MLGSAFLEMLSAKYARETFQSCNPSLTWKSREKKGSQLKLGFVSLLCFLILNVLTVPNFQYWQKDTIKQMQIKFLPWCMVRTQQMLILSPTHGTQVNILHTFHESKESGIFATAPELESEGLGIMTRTVPGT